MSVRPSTVLVGWLLANVVLAVILVAFGESAFGYVLYFASAFPVTVFAVVLWRFWGEPGAEPDRLLVPGTANAVIVLALGVTSIGLGLIFGIWLWLPGAAVTVGAAVTLWLHRSVRPTLPAQLPDLPVYDESTARRSPQNSEGRRVQP